MTRKPDVYICAEVLRALPWEGVYEALGVKWPAEEQGSLAFRSDDTMATVSCPRITVVLELCP